MLIPRDEIGKTAAHFAHPKNGVNDVEDPTTAATD